MKEDKLKYKNLHNQVLFCQLHNKNVIIFFTPQTYSNKYYFHQHSGKEISWSHCHPGVPTVTALFTTLDPSTAFTLIWTLEGTTHYAHRLYSSQKSENACWGTFYLFQKRASYCSKSFLYSHTVLKEYPDSTTTAIQ